LLWSCAPHPRSAWSNHRRRILRAFGRIAATSSRVIAPTTHKAAASTTARSPITETRNDPFLRRVAGELERRHPRAHQAKLAKSPSPQLIDRVGAKLRTLQSFRRDRPQLLRQSSHRRTSVERDTEPTSQQHSLLTKRRIQPAHRRQQLGRTHQSASPELHQHPEARGRVSRRLSGYSEDSCGWGDSP
jgi:hypothetical protein